MFVMMGRRVSIMIVFAIIMHLVFAACVAYSDDALGVTAIHSINRYVPSFLLSTVLIAASLAAFAGMTLRPWGFVLLLIPQQLLLMASAFGAIEAIWIAQFADGVIRARVFLVADQLWSVIACAGHTAAIVAHARRSAYKK